MRALSRAEDHECWFHLEHLQIGLDRVLNRIEQVAAMIRFIGFASS
ncbi:MAG: hypothetical protein MZU97_05125 [Bacillus subtilis]|nr:hypothetical protein [Bacillus subtilis]